jgi:hypothetical protein
MRGGACSECLTTSDAPMGDDAGLQARLAPIVRSIRVRRAASFGERSILMRIIQRASLTIAFLLVAAGIGPVFAQGAGAASGGGTNAGGTGTTPGAASGSAGDTTGKLGGTVGAPTVDGGGTASGATNVGPNGESGDAGLDGTAKSELPGSHGTSNAPGGMQEGLNPGASRGGNAAGSMNAPPTGAASGNVGATLGR